MEVYRNGIPYGSDEFKLRAYKSHRRVYLRSALGKNSTFLPANSTHARCALAALGTLTSMVPCDKVKWHPLHEFPSWGTFLKKNLLLPCLRILQNLFQNMFLKHFFGRVPISLFPDVHLLYYSTR